MLETSIGAPPGASPLARRLTVVAVVLPLAGFLAAMRLLWGGAVSSRDLADTLFPLWGVLGLLLPAVAGFALSGGSLFAAFTAFVWAGLVRVFLLHHATAITRFPRRRSTVCGARRSRPDRTGR
jgi:hypothetical protein